MADGKGKESRPAKPQTGSGVQENAKMPKGGRKGGTIFPRLDLKQALEYSKKLVSRTAVNPQPEATILAGVFNNAGSQGKIRLSALKQFGLLEGTPAAYKATQLARNIEAAADDTERENLILRAIQAPKLYRELINTYHGDRASRGQIRSRVQQLAVHPDASDTCADLFIASAVTAKLATTDGDGIRLRDATQHEIPAENDPPGEEESLKTDIVAEVKKEDELADTITRTDGQTDGSKFPAPRPRMAADVAVNLTVDSSLDGDKLEKQLALLRRYGLI
jgi:hypothetical protein